MSADSVTADEVVVEGEYFQPSGEKDPSLRQIHDRLQMQMQLEGYQPENPQKSVLGSRSIIYIYTLDSPSKSAWWKLKNWLRLTTEHELQRETYINNLRTTRDDLLFRIRFRMVPVQLEEEAGIHIQAKVEPAVLLKHEQIERVDDYNAQNVIRRCKERIEDIAIELGWEPWREPHTTAENLRETVRGSVREELAQTKYGNYVLELADEGDEAFRYRLLHPSLASYIHSIEWAIICYMEDEHGEDLIDEEVEGEFGYNFGQLIDELPAQGIISQKTREELRQFTVYRRWMGHHKSGKLTKSNVASVKSRLGILLEELFQ